MEIKKIKEELYPPVEERLQCYSVTTRRFTLRCARKEWLKTTLDLYNEVLLFYYRLFLRTEEEQTGRLTGQSNQRVLRELEIMTIPGRDGRTVPRPLPWKGVPLYFRRAAINGAIAEARSFLGRRRAGMISAETERFRRGVTFYKGMFRDLTDSGISLKLWDGQSWVWVRCRLKGRELPADARWLSPTLQLTGKGAVLHVPVREDVGDGRKARERMKAGTRICSLQFTNGDAFAVGVILEPDGSQTAVRFFRGGNQYTHLCRMRLEKIKESGKAMGLTESVADLKTFPEQEPGRETVRSGRSSSEIDQEERSGGVKSGKPYGELNQEGRSGKGMRTGCGGDETAGRTCRDRGRNPERYNQKYWMKLKHLNDYYAHLISREIVDFCRENQAEMIAVPRYDESFSRYVMGRVGNWSVLGLSRRISTLLSYKAWQSGIVVVEVHAGGTGACCARCGETVRKCGNNYECPQGHHGNRYLNTARNLGIKCLKGFGREVI